VKILVTNDDGIMAPGLLALAAALRDTGEVTVVAPESPQSAVGHGITLHKPLRLRRMDIGVEVPAYSSNGTPADCVILGTLGELGRPDVVVSGINAGANLGEEVLYSGTVSAALEAALHDIPALAISVCAYEDVHLDAAQRIAPFLVHALAQFPLASGTVLNVNVPNVEPDEIRGIALTRLGRRRYQDVVIKRTDPNGRPYYWFKGSPEESDSVAGTDIHAVAQDRISITLVHFDLTSDGHWDGLGDLQTEWGLI
jgi:5'-nucleotidase